MHPKLEQYLDENPWLKGERKYAREWLKVRGVSRSMLSLLKKEGMVMPDSDEPESMLSARAYNVLYSVSGLHFDNHYRWIGPRHVASLEEILPPGVRIWKCRNAGEKTVREICAYFNCPVPPRNPKLQKDWKYNPWTGEALSSPVLAGSSDAADTTHG